MADHPPGFPEFFAYWRELPKKDHVPDWDIIPAAKRFPRLVQHLFLVEVRDGPALPIRLAGSAFRDRFGVELTGRDLLDMTLEAQRPLRYARYRAVVDWPCGIQNFGRVTGPSGVPVTYGSLLLPVRRAGSDQRLALGLLVETPGARPSERAPTNVPLPERTVFVDIGAGVPDFDPQPETDAAADATLASRQEPP
jgi:hypothetical protein